MMGWQSIPISHLEQNQVVVVRGPSSVVSSLTRLGGANKTSSANPFDGQDVFGLEWRDPGFQWYRAATGAVLCETYT